MKVAIAGAGILGASVAYHLCRLGAEVVIVDPMLAGRATAAGAGIICPWSTAVEDDDWYRIIDTGAVYYADLVEHLAADGEHVASYRRTGALLASTDAGLLDAAQARLSGRRAGRPEIGEVARLSPEEARRLFPLLHPDASAVHVSGGARVDGAQMADAMLRAAVRLGATYVRDLARPIVENGRAIGLQVGDTLYRADATVLATGVWPFGDSGKPAGGAVLQRGQIMHFRLPGRQTGDWPIVLPLNGYYILTFDDSRIVVGATREEGTGFDLRVTAAGMAEVLAAGLAVAPGLAEATVIETRVGLRPMAPVRKPVLGLMPGIDDLFVGNGLGASGLTMGPFAGRLLAERIVGVATAIPIAPYAPDVVS